MLQQYIYTKTVNHLQLSHMYMSSSKLQQYIYTNTVYHSLSPRFEPYAQIAVTYVYVQLYIVAIHLYEQNTVNHSLSSRFEQYAQLSHMYMSSSMLQQYIYTNTVNHSLSPRFEPDAQLSHYMYIASSMLQQYICIYGHSQSFIAVT